MDDNRRDDLMEVGITHAVATPGTNIPTGTPAAGTGRRGAVRSLGAAAMALLAVQSLGNAADAKNKKKVGGDKKGKKAKPGPAGPQGPAGPAGPSGLLGLAGAVNQVAIANDATDEVIANCAAGQVVISGGAFLDNDLCFLVATQPATVGVGWYGRATCPAGSNGGNLTVTVICAP